MTLLKNGFPNRHQPQYFLNSLLRRSMNILQYHRMKFCQACLLVAVLTGRPTLILAHGDAHELIENVSALIVESPNDAELFLRRAELNLAHGDLKAAEGDYLQARKLQPNLDVVSLGLARIRNEQGRTKETLKLLETFLTAQPKHTGGRVLRAELLEKKGEWKKAELDLRTAAAASTEPQFTTLHAQLLERHGQAAEAVRCLDAASRSHGRLPVLEQLALDIQERAGLTDQALKRLDEFITREPRPDIWLVRKAKLLTKNGRAEEAKMAWNQAASAFERIPAHKRETKSNKAMAKEIQAARSTTASK